MLHILARLCLTDLSRKPKGCPL